MKKRVINRRINYIKGIQSNRNKLLETILWTIETERETTRKYMNVTNINFNDIRLNSKEYLKQFMIKWGRNIQEDELVYRYTRLQTTQPTSGGAVTVISSCCANCVEPPRPQQWGPDLPFFGHAGHADPLDCWRCCSQKRVMSRPIQVRQL